MSGLRCHAHDHETKSAGCLTAWKLDRDAVGKHSEQANVSMVVKREDKRKPYAHFPVFGQVVRVTIDKLTGAPQP